MGSIKYEWNKEKTIKQGRKNGQTIEIIIENHDISKEMIKDIFSLPKLEQLEIINCNLKIIPNEINKLKNSLKTLNLKGNTIHNIPNSLLALVKLESLNLSQNNIKKLPKDLTRFSNLKSLNCFKNEDLIIDENLLELKNLELLNLGFTNVGKVIDDISQLSNLTNLDLSGNNIEEIPLSLFLLTKLKYLSLKNNKITNISDDIKKLNVLEVFDLRFNNIDNVSKEILDLNLNELFLEGNPFLLIKELQNTDVKNMLNKLFNIYEKYDNSKKIDLSNFNIDYIPNLSQFSDLKILDLSGNNIIIENYSKEDKKNKTYRYKSYCENNKIFQRLTKLKEIYFNKNNIVEIPEYLTDITTLEILDLSSNNIEKISNSLLKLTNLKKLNLIDNPVSQIKGFSLKKSPKEIIEFLLLNQDKKLTTLNEAKLLVVGDENSGKSSLVERMVHNKFNAEYNSTKGIDISQYPISKDLVESMLYFYCFGFKVEPNIKVNIWDFAGQEITYQVHNLFMSKESLYLLVIDGQKEDNIVENFDWLETISANADNPPIIIVVTKHENNRSHEIDEVKYREEFPNIEKIHYVSSKENFGFCELKQSILLSLSKFSKQKIPKSYEVVKSEIEKRRIEKLEKNLYMLSADDFDDICSEHKMFEERDNIRTILNDIGVMIGMDNDDMHVINPTKMIDAIYEIIRSKKINDNGELELKKDKDRHYNWIIQFLIKSKIAFKIDDLKVMIPSRLPMKRPKGFLKSDFIRDDKVYGLNFRYKYKRFKKSVFFEFLIKIQEDIYDVQPEYWANGIIWKYDEFQVLVLASKVDRTIDIHISKDTEKARKLLTKIRKKLDEINKGKWGIVQKVAVVDTDDDCIYYKSYKFLKEKLKKNAKDVELNIKEKPKIFPLAELLDRYEYLEEIKENDTLKPLIITEGKTDKRILEIAWKKLYNDIDMPFRIQDAGLERRKKEHGKYTENIEKSGGSDVLRQQLEHSTALNSELTIGVFDNDSAGYRDFKGLQESMFGKCSKTTKQRKHIQNNTYAILLPVPDFRRKFVSSNYPEQKYFVIEHYFLDEILEEYDMKGNPIVEDSQIFKIKGKKDDFSKSIEEINKEEFKHFKLLFDVIKEIIKENKSSNT